MTFSHEQGEILISFHILEQMVFCLLKGNNEEVDEDFERCQGAPRPMDLETPATYTDLTLVLDQFNNPLDIDAQKELAGWATTFFNMGTFISDLICFSNP